MARPEDCRHFNIYRIYYITIIHSLEHQGFRGVGGVVKGWIRLHRRVRDNPVFNDLQLFRLWTICLTEAAHKSYEQPVGRQVVSLEPGQFVTGRFDLHELYNRGLKRSDKVAAEYTVWRWLQVLEKQGLVSIKSSNKFSIVTVVNWAFYQGDEQINEQQNEHELSNKLATNEHELSTNKNVKNLENVKNDKKNKSTSRNKKPTYPEDSPYFKMAVYLKGKIDSMTASEGLASFVITSYSIHYTKLYDIIILDKRNSSQKQREDFLHELGHLLRHEGNQILLPKPFVQYP